MAFAMHIHAGHRSATVVPEPEVVIVVGRRTTSLLIEAAALANKLGYREQPRGRRGPDEVRVVRATGWHDAAQKASRCARCVLVTDIPDGPLAAIVDSNGRSVRLLSVEEAFGGRTTARHSARAGANVPTAGILDRVLGHWLPRRRVNARS